MDQCSGSEAAEEDRSKHRVSCYIVSSHPWSAAFANCGQAGGTGTDVDTLACCCLAVDRHSSNLCEVPEVAVEVVTHRFAWVGVHDRRLSVQDLDFAFGTAEEGTWEMDVCCRTQADRCEGNELVAAGAGADASGLVVCPLDLVASHIQDAARWEEGAGGNFVIVRVVVKLCRERRSLVIVLRRVRRAWSIPDTCLSRVVWIARLDRLPVV